MTSTSNKAVLKRQFDRQYFDADSDHTTSNSGIDNDQFRDGVPSLGPARTLGGHPEITTGELHLIAGLMIVDFECRVVGSPVMNWLSALKEIQTAPHQRLPTMDPRRPSQIQYQHYIPRFILRRFQENPGHVKTKKEKNKAYWKSRKTGVFNETVLVYDIATGTLESKPIGKVYGEVNLYQDIKNVADVNYVEEKFSALESHAADIINDLHASLKQGEFHMKRKSLEALRKFLFLMHYRSAARSLTYFEDNPENAPLRDWIQKYKEAKGLDSHIEVWLHGLRYHLDTPHHMAVAEGEALQGKYNVRDLSQIAKLTKSATLENWHAVEYVNVANSYFLGIWEAPEGSEFVLGDNGFGLWEGLLYGSPSVHRLYIISPRLALVLRNVSTKLPLPKVAIHSSLSDIPIVGIAPQYINFTESDYSDSTLRGIAMAKYRTTPQAQEDIFTFKITTLSPSQTYFVNEVILLNVKKNGAITFSSKDNMLNMLCSYVCSGDIYVLQDKSKFEPLVHTLLPTEVKPKPLSPQEPKSSPPPLSPSPTPTSSTSKSEVSRETLLVGLMQGIVSGTVTFKTRYDQAHAVYHCAVKIPPLENPVSSSIERLSSGASDRFRSLMLPPPDDFKPRPDARLVKTLSVRDSDFIMAVGGEFLTKLGIVTGEGELCEIIFDASIIGFLLWVARNRHDGLNLLTGELTAPLVL
ncbi:hypothetical protein BU17DRAFT_65050 [Hysterangium stoloniferum]|nr:hypothetical protein BU17DRAFT_65050 [Hysterangium stoloniferum]